MNREELLQWALERYGTEAEYLWEDDDGAVLRNRGGKWYAVLLRVERKKLGLSGTGSIDIVNVKGVPSENEVLWQEPGIRPAYHMNKKHWLSLFLDGSVGDRALCRLLELSYRLTEPRVPRQKKQSRKEKEVAK